MAETMKQTTPASEFCRNFGRYKDEAIARGSVPVSSNGRPVGAYLSQSEYEAYLSLKRRETQILKIDKLPKDVIEDIRSAQHGVMSE